MTLFKEFFNEGYFKYHHKPISRNSLDTRMFVHQEDGRDPLLVDAVRSHIIYDIQSLNDIDTPGTTHRVLDYILTGPVLTELSTKTSPAYIVAQINTVNINDILYERLYNHAKSLSGRLLTGTTHPVIYKLTSKPFDMSLYTHAYHPFWGKWIKKPSFLGK